MVYEETNKYQQGKIYCIRNTINDMIYIGSTCQKLSQRMTNHRSDMNKPTHQNMKLYKAMNELGKENFYIELIEEYPCDNIEQLNRREGEIIRNLQPILNTQVAGRTIKEWREDNKEYLQEDKRIYHLENREKLNEKCRKWYKDNIDKIKEFRSTVIKCPCGVSLTQQHNSRHLKSKHHQNYEKSLSENND